MNHLAILQVKPLHPYFTAEVRGVNFGGVWNQAEIGIIRALMDRYSVLVFPEADVPDEDQVAFCRALGPGRLLGHDRVVSGKMAREIIRLSNIGDDGKILPPDHRREAFRGATELWHTDESFSKDRGAYSLLKAVEAPGGGVAPTEFATMIEAYRDLPEGLRDRVEEAVAEHSVWHSRELAGYETTEAQRRDQPSALQPLVNTNKRTGERSLYLATHIERIVGLSSTESDDLLDELFGFATHDRYIYRHNWSTGDLILWDNLATMHRAVAFDMQKYRRDMRRTTTLEVPY